MDSKVTIMANIKFIIRDMNAKTEQTVYVTSRFGRNEKLMYATPLKVKPSLWDEKRERVKNTGYCSYREEVNGALNAIDALIKSFMAQVAMSESEVLSKESLKNLLDVHFGKKRMQAKDFHSYFEEFIRSCETRTNPKRGGQTLSYKTMREYARTHYYILEYEKKRGIKLDFNNINQSFMNDFIAFLQEQNLSTNTIGHKIVCIKALMRSANENDLTSNMKFQFFKGISEQSDNIALSEEELDSLARFDFSSNPRLERVRDLFLVGCWTGLRFSDFTSIRKENILDGMITITQHKTDASVVIPVHPVFKAIWNKYEGILPSNISNQKFNDYIKEVCKIVGINSRVLKSITRGGKKQTTVYEKWQLVSSHTARRSFATNLYKSGFPAVSIMQITGHRTESAFLKYIKVTKEEHAKMLMKHWQKKGNLLKVI